MWFESAQLADGAPPLIGDLRELRQRLAGSADYRPFGIAFGPVWLTGLRSLPLDPAPPGATGLRLVPMVAGLCDVEYTTPYKT